MLNGYAETSSTVRQGMNHALLFEEQVIPIRKEETLCLSLGITPGMSLIFLQEREQMASLVF